MVQSFGSLLKTIAARARVCRAGGGQESEQPHNQVLVLCWRGARREGRVGERGREKKKQVRTPLCHARITCSQQTSAAAVCFAYLKLPSSFTASCTPASRRLESTEVSRASASVRYP